MTQGRQIRMLLEKRIRSNKQLRMPNAIPGIGKLTGSVFDSGR
jgi:hypothetical protein